jgi:hypothetical protein
LDRIDFVPIGSRKASRHYAQPTQQLFRRNNSFGDMAYDDTVIRKHGDFALDNADGTVGIPEAQPRASLKCERLSQQSTSNKRPNFQKNSP